MALKNEVKVGILGACAAVLIFWGYNFLKGRNVFSSGIVLNAIYDSVEGLQIAAPVTINGYRVGAVTNIYLGSKEFQGKVIAEMSLDAGTNISKDPTSRAMLIQPSLMGGKTIELKSAKPCSGADCLQNGEMITGQTASMIDGVKPIVEPYINKLDSAQKLWAGVASQESGELKQTLADIRATVGNLKSISDNVNNLLVSSSVNVAITVSNLKAVSDNLKSNNDEITTMLKNINAITQQVKDGNVEKLLKETNETVETMNKTIAELQGVLKKTNETMAQVQLLANVKDQNGLLNKLIYDKQFSTDLQTTVLDVQYLVKDIRLHPERYRTVLSGRKKKYKHEDAINDPAHKIK